MNPTQHDWTESVPGVAEKPWTCKLCGFRTANLRHIENGFCRHDWDDFPLAGVANAKVCKTCGIVQNTHNGENPCIGRVSIETRNEMPMLTPDDFIDLGAISRRMRGYERKGSTVALHYLAQSAIDHLRKARAGERWFLGSDNSGHEYAVPEARKDEWSAWQELDENDERGWQEPDYAIRIDGRFTFTDPRCE